jgi:hypothetical protein
MGYKTELFLDVEQAEDAECSYCLNVWRGPVRTICNHIFCRGCIINWRRQKGKGKASCPTCRSPLRHQDWVPLPRQDCPDLQMWCINRDLGCNEIVSYRNCTRHYTTCLHRPQRMEALYDALPRNSPRRRRQARLLYNELPFEK